MAKHRWAVTDTQGYAMECVICGKEIIHPVISYIEDDDWTEGECEENG